MAPTTTRDEGEEASGSLSAARRPRRRRPRGSLAIRLAPTATFVAGSRRPRGSLAIRRTPTATHEEGEDASRFPSLVDEPSSQRGKRRRKGDAKERSKKRKKASKCRDEEKNDSRRTGDQEAAAAPSASAATEQASSSDSEASSAASSPLRWPCRPTIVKAPGVEFLKTLDPETEAAYEELELKYREKEVFIGLLLFLLCTISISPERHNNGYLLAARHRNMVTFVEPKAYSCLASEKFLPVRDSATQTVLKAGKAVLGLSSYIDGKPLSRSSGFLIDWDEESKGSTILTSALLIRVKLGSEGEWSGTDEYAPDAEVVVHLLDKNETTVAAHLLHYDKYFNIALFKIDTDISAQIPCFSSEVMYGQGAFVLGRDDGLFLNIKHGSIQYQGPNTYERHHHMFISCGTISQCGAGGPVIDFGGQVLGMAYPAFKFIPSSILLKCLRMWKKFRCVPRLHVGMKFSAIKFLDPAHVEKISIKYDIDSGLIVREVSAGSVAEKLGVRIGDIIESLNGESVATTVELENMLLSICEDHHDKGRDIGSTIDLTIGVFHARKESRRTRSLVLKLSNEIEVIPY